MHQITLLLITFIILIVSEVPVRLYDQPEVKISPKNLLKLFVGLHKVKLTSKEIWVPFSFDYNSILISEKEFLCSDDYYSTMHPPPSVSIALPNKEDYVKYEQSTYVGVSKIRNVLANNSERNILKTPLLITSFTSLLGLGPKSPIWSNWHYLYSTKSLPLIFSFFWLNEYRPRMKLQFFKDYREPLALIEKNMDTYNFWSVGDNFQEKRRLLICIDMEYKNLMKTNDPIFNDIKKVMCFSPLNCIKVADLKDNIRENFILKIYNEQAEVLTTLLTSDFMNIEQQNIKWKFEVDRNLSCDITFGRLFFKYNYFNIIYIPEKNIKIGISRVKNFDFISTEFWKWISVILSTTIFLQIGIFYSIRRRTLVNKEII